MKVFKHPVKNNGKYYQRGDLVPGFDVIDEETQQYLLQEGIISSGEGPEEKISLGKQEYQRLVNDGRWSSLARDLFNSLSVSDLRKFAKLKGVFLSSDNMKKADIVQAIFDKLGLKEDGAFEPEPDAKAEAEAEAQ